MDQENLKTRILDVMGKAASDPVATAAEAKALLREVEALAADADETPPEMEGLQSLLAMLSDPDQVRQMADATASYVPGPAIFDAIDDGDPEAVAAALEDWDVNQMHGDLQCTALYQALSNACGVSLAIINLLLDRGADPKLGLGADYNVLHGLGFSNCSDVAPADLAKVIARCVALGADLEQRSDKLGWTPLITAASEWNAVAVEALLLAGADANAVSGTDSGACLSGQTALAFAEGHPETWTLLNRAVTQNVI